LISEAEKDNDKLAYFAFVYLKTTLKIKEAIASGQFENGFQIEKLNIIMARNYLDAYSRYVNQKLITLSWRKAFIPPQKSQLILTQHLLLSINAQVNLNLGIAIAEILENEDFESLRADFNQVHSIFSSVAQEVLNKMSSDWPFLKLLLKITGNNPKYWFRRIISDGRNEIWDFAVRFSNVPDNNKARALSVRNQEVISKTEILFDSGPVANFIFRFIRNAEEGTVENKLKRLGYPIK
jgi:hypothetical protein